jgi:CheY-like chemotaxis protein
MAEESGLIIMVDDEVELVRSTLGRLRKEFGESRVQGTTDPREAASWVDLEKPSALITDLRMPHMTGLELVAHTHARWGQVPAVLTTAYPTPQVQDGERAGTFAYLPKPFPFQVLRDALQRLLRLPVKPAFSGAVAVTMLADVVQLYALSTPGGKLTVESGEDAGSIWLQRGSVVHAVAGGRVGVEAFFEVLSWASGRFSFAPGEPETISIDLSLNEILLESYRRNDERKPGGAPAKPDAPPADIDDVFAQLEGGPGLSAVPSPAVPAVPPAVAVDPQPQEKHMANNVKESLTKLETIDGFIGGAVVDSESGMCVGMVGGGSLLNMEVAGAANSEVVRSKRKAMKALNLKDEIEDILITLGKQYHLIRPLKGRSTFFFYVALDRTKANLAMARFHLSEVEKDIVI